MILKKNVLDFYISIVNFKYFLIGGFLALAMQEDGLTSKIAKKAKGLHERRILSVSQTSPILEQ